MEEQLRQQQRQIQDLLAQVLHFKLSSVRLDKQQQQRQPPQGQLMFGRGGSSQCWTRKFLAR